MARCELQNRSGSVALGLAPSATTPGDLKNIVTALQASMLAENTWRVVELWSTDLNSPWEATVEWSGGALGPRKAFVVVHGATRLCCNASSVKVDARALSTTVNTNGNVAIADGYGEFRNQWVQRGVAPVEGGAIEVATPPWAEFVRVEISDAAQYGAVVISMVDGGATIRANYLGNGQPQPGIPVGDAVKANITLPANVNYRVTWLLGL